MKIAFLFDEHYPNYGQALKVLRALHPDGLVKLNTLVSRGRWGWCTKAFDPEQRAKRVRYMHRLLFHMEGGLSCGVRDLAGIERLTAADVNAIV